MNQPFNCTTAVKVGARRRSTKGVVALRVAAFRTRRHFLSLVGVNTQVEAGQTLGVMTDLLGDPLGSVVSPVEGVVLFTVSSPAIKAGGLLLGIGVT